MSDTRKVTDFMKRLPSLYSNLIEGVPDLQNAILERYSLMERPSGGALNDVHPDLFKYITTLAYSMKTIEEPDLAMNKVAEKYAEKLGPIVEKLQTGIIGSTSLDVKPLKFPGFLEKSGGSGKLKWEINGFGSLDTDTFMGVNSNSYTAYTRMIYYLLRFIAVLDLTTSVNGDDIITFLRGQDSFTFGPLVVQIASDISSKDHSNPIDVGTNKDIIYHGIERGLAYVATEIINKFKTLSSSTHTNELNFRNGVEELKKGFIAGTIDGIAIGKFSTKIGDISTELKAIKSDPIDDAIATKLFGASSHAKDRFDNGILNVYHLDKGIADGTPAELQFKGYVGSGPGSGKTLAQLIDEWKLDVVNNKYFPENHSGDSYDVILGKVGFKTNADILADWTQKDITASRTQYQTYPPFPTVAPVAVSDYPNASFLYTPKITETGNTNDKLHRLNDKLKELAPSTNELTILPDTVTTAIKAIIAKLNLSPITGLKDLSQILSAKAGVLGIIVAAYKNNMDLSVGINATNADKIKEAMLTNIRGFDRIENRLTYIYTNINKSTQMFAGFSQLSEQFIEGFTLGTKKLQSTNGKVTYIDPKKRKPLSAWKELYSFITENTTNIAFFDDIFNLVEIDTNTKKIKDTQNIPLDRALKENDLTKYSLNVKKKSPEQPSSLQQLGGNGERYDPSYFTVLIPQFDPNKIGKIWLTYKISIPHNLIKSHVFLRNEIARKLYYASLSELKKRMQIVDPSIIIIPLDIVNDFYNGGFQLNISHNSSARVYNPLEYYSVGDSAVPGWENVDMKLAGDIAKETDRWEREGYKWFYRNKDKEEIPREESMDCAFLNPNRCKNFIDCIKTQGTSDECLKFLYNPSYINKIPDNNTDIITQVKLMHPIAASSFLSKIGFRIERSEVPLAWDGRGKTQMRRDVVESVTKWMSNLENLKDICGNQHENIKKMLRVNCTGNRKLFSYLQILVEWVNANPQVLNEEETLDKPPKPVSQRKADDSLVIYDYVSSQAQKRKVTSLCDGLYRMKSNLENNLSGWNSETLLNNIYNTPNLSMPLNRAVIISANPHMSNRTYGGNSAFEYSIKNYSELAGSRVFRDWYDEIKNIMKHMTGDNKYKMRIKENTETKIEAKLEAFEKMEKEIIVLMQEVIDRKNLFRASNGRLDLGQIQRVGDLGQIQRGGDAASDKYDAERRDRALGLEKHANLVNLISSYQKRAINLTDVIKTIAETVAEKLNMLSNDKSAPMTNQISQSFTEKIRYYK